MCVQMESSRRRMSVAVREKQDCEDKYCKAVLDVEKKVGHLPHYVTHSYDAYNFLVIFSF